MQLVAIIQPMLVRSKKRETEILLLNLIKMSLHKQSCYNISIFLTKEGYV
jgi:hypothetical protein